MVTGLGLGRPSRHVRGPPLLLGGGAGEVRAERVGVGTAVRESGSGITILRHRRVEPRIHGSQKKCEVIDFIVFNDES